MKLKNSSYLFFALGILLSVGSCSDETLNVEPPKGTPLEENYYQNEAEAYTGLIAVYDILNKQSGGFDNFITMLNAGSDDHYAGGGSATDGAGMQSFSNYTISSSTIPTSFWRHYFQGIFRTNTLLSKLPNIPMDAAKKMRFAAECKALRAYFHFELVRCFKNVPLITSLIPASEIYNITQAPPEAVYAQIEKDLSEAMSDLPFSISNTTTESARWSKGTVKALLGKVYLNHFNLIENYDLPNPDNKDYQTLAAAEFAAVNGTPGGTSQYGYKLLSNFSDLWVISNKFNSESILEISHTDQGNTGWGNWGSGSDEGNSINQMVGIRNYNRSSFSAPDFAAGWSFNPFTEAFYDIIKTDPRFTATIADLKTLEAEGKIEYEHGYQDTGYYLKKFMPMKSDFSTGGGNGELNYKQNVYAIRLADTYLMEAEALGATGPRAQALLDAVRARVGLPSTPVSLDAIIAERRLELAGEGHRWMDLVRTGRAATVLASRGFIAGKHEIWPIPLKELENTQIVQNPNY
jgi:hypothetical protein